VFAGMTYPRSFKERTMQSKTIKSDLLLLTAAFIWGTAFVAQRKGMEYIGPFTYNGFRFALGGLVLLPLVFWLRKINPKGHEDSGRRFFIQGGMLYTTAGKAGFITSLYVVVVPILGLFLGHRIGLSVWVGAILAVIGLYFLSITQKFRIGHGDALVLLSAFFWALHVLWIGYLARRANPIYIACLQFFVCSVLSFLFAVFTEEIQFPAVREAAIPILYGGVFSAGIAFTLQVISQRTCPPAHAAIIMSLETLFAALAGWIVLHEILSLRNLIGCAFMLAGILVVQLAPRIKREDI